MSQQSYIVLLSGGLDSTVSLAKVLSEGEKVELALFFDYGQKAGEREFKAASDIARYYDVHLKVISLDWLRDITSTALVSDEAIPDPVPDMLDDKMASLGSAQAVWVPNRNGVLINVAGAFAESSGAGCIITGFNREEAATFPDNSLQFIETISRSLYFSTLSHVKVVSPLAKLDKVEIVKLAHKLKVPLEMIWSCYRGGDSPCGRCESCLRLARAMEQANK